MAATVVDQRGPAVITDYGYATARAVIEAAQPGDVVEYRRNWTVAAPIVVDKPLTIRCTRGGKVSTGGDSHAFDVTASGVTFEKIGLAGAGSGTAGTQSAIRTVGTVSSPITDLTVRECVITGFRKYGIEGEHIHDFTFENNRIENIAYAGIMVTSGKGGTISANTIRNITQPSGLTNSYGIALTRNGTQTLAVSPRTSDVMVEGNTVDGVPGWEGIDTHGGEGIVIKDNTVRNTNVGIALVASTNTSGVNTYAAKRIKVINNTVISGVTDGSRSVGIQLVGTTANTDTVTEYADAVIQGNTVDGHGLQGVANTGAIFLQATIGTIVTGNVVTEAGLNAIHATHNNKSLVVDNNTAVDTWTESMAYTSVLRVSSHHNTIKTAGNIAVRANKVATLVNDRGLFASGGLNNVSIQWGDNDMTATTSGIIDGGLSFFRVSATKLAFGPSVEPGTRPVLRSDATDLASAIALINQTAAGLKKLDIMR